ncbi:MAG: LURP-one-related family protein [Candidatus Atabeyarchaeum deiterrae]
MESGARFCTRCGARLKPDARFCFECGAPVFRDRSESRPVEPYETTEEPFQTPETPVPEYEPQPSPVKATEPVAPLFDVSRRYYVIDRRWWGWGSGAIYDEKGIAVGHMHRRAISARKAIEFREADDQTVSAIIHKKLVAIRDTFDIEDAHENALGRVKQKILAVLRPLVWMEDPRGKKILEAQGDFMGFTFKVYDMEKNLVAEIDKTDMWKDIFVGGSVFDFSQKYGVVINTNIDRRLIVPLAIAIDDAIHEDRKDRSNVTMTPL